MRKSQIFRFCFYILIFKLLNASPIEQVTLTDEKWLTKSKFSTGVDDNIWKRFLVSKSSKLSSRPSLNAFKSKSEMNSNPISDGQAVKLLDPFVREALNQLVTKMNLNRQKSTNGDHSESKNVQSFYPKCDYIEMQSSIDEDSKQNFENKQIKENKFLPLYFHLQGSAISKASSTILKSNLRIYLRKDEEGCACKLDSNLNLDSTDDLQLSVYEVLSKVIFTPLKEVSKKKLIETVKFNRCCDQLITFDLTKLAKTWKKYPDSNNGLLLQITDNLGNKLNTEDFIHTMNCSDKSLPIPYIRMIHPNLSSLMKMKEVYYPTLDVAFKREDNIFSRKSSEDNKYANI